MARACIINGCPSVSGKELGVYYYRLPKQEDLKNRWMSMITPKPGLILNDESLICSRHFKEMDYINYTKRILRKNAVPTMVPLLNLKEVDDTVTEIKSELSSTDCESETDAVPEEEVVEDIKVEEMDIQNYTEDSTIRVVDVQSILKNQVETSTTAAQPVQPRHVNQIEGQTLREAFKNFTDNTNTMLTQRNAPTGVSTVINNNNDVNSLSNFIYVSQQQQQTPGSLLIELLPLSFPQTSQAALAMQQVQTIQPAIQQNQVLVRPVYVHDSKLNQPRLIGSQRIMPQSLLTSPQILRPLLVGQQKPLLGQQQRQQIVVSQNVQQIVVPQTVPQQNVEVQNDHNTPIKSEASEQIVHQQTDKPETSGRLMNGGACFKRSKKLQKMTRSVGMGKKIAANVEAIKKNQNAFAKLKVNHVKLQKKYDEVRVILDLLKEKKLNVEHIDKFYKPKPIKDDTVSCGVWWRGSGFVGTRPK